MQFCRSLMILSWCCIYGMFVTTIPSMASMSMIETHLRGSSAHIQSGNIIVAAAVSTIQSQVPDTSERSSTTVSPTTTTTTNSSLFSFPKVNHGEKTFTTLQCNANLSTTSCDTTTWTSMFGTSDTHTDLLIIPCGVCVTMDYTNITNSTLTLMGGLDIQGKLVFPDDYGDTLNTTMTVITPKVIVQGELHITSITKSINGIPKIKLIMIGEDVEQSFIPIGNNGNICSAGNAPCTIGKKAIVVAGGQVNLHGIPTNTTTWTRLYDVAGGVNASFPDTIVLEDNGIKDKWSIGAEIVFTSHSRENVAQERTIIAIAPSTIPGYSKYKLNAPIQRPTTIMDSRNFAVEVALLSRNIVFQGGPDTTSSQHGGHFMIMNTPIIVQIIDGIEIRNFGQQGLLGRYPIHFHYSDDVTGSVVRKNSIRESNQRCVVVHGTNNLRIEGNVAYDTKGHCYVLEDGIEIGNAFIRNFAALTRIPDTLIPPSATANNGVENDDQPAAFWITNPESIFDGNVAAGSDDSGYWFDPKIRGKRALLYEGYDPQTAPILLFKDNVVHSAVGKKGAIKTYTPGYRSHSVVTLDGIKSFRNLYVGIQLHRSNNIVIGNSLFADNPIGIDIDRAEAIDVVNTTIIGESDSYRQLFPGNEICERGTRTGIDLYTWIHEFNRTGATFTNVTLRGFSQTQVCPKASSIKYDDQTLTQGLFGFYSTFQNMNIENGPNSIDFCIVKQEYFRLLYTLDLDGSMKPSSAISSNGISTLVATDDGSSLPFVDRAKCTYVEAGCYNYCTNTCFRSIRYDVTINDNEDYSLRVCLRNDTSQCTTFQGGSRAGDGRYTYNAHLPVGNLYDAAFLDAQGRETSMTFSQHEETSYCPDSSFDVVLLHGRRSREDTSLTILRLFDILLMFFSRILSLFKR